MNTFAEYFELPNPDAETFAPRTYPPHNDGVNWAFDVCPGCTAERGSTHGADCMYLPAAVAA